MWQRECNTRFWTNINGRLRARRGQALCLASLRAVNVRDETACLSVANVDVVDLGLIENPGDCGLGRSVVNFFAHSHPAMAPVAFEHERQRTKAVWEFILRRVCGAWGFVDEDRAR